MGNSPQPRQILYDEGPDDLSWEIVYESCQSLTTKDLLVYLQMLSKKHSLPRLVSIGIVPHDSVFMDIDPQFWIAHFKNIPEIISNDASKEFISDLLRLSLLRYASMDFYGVLNGLKEEHYEKSLKRRQDFFESIYANREIFQTFEQQPLYEKRIWNKFEEVLHYLDHDFRFWLHVHVQVPLADRQTCRKQNLKRFGTSHSFGKSPNNPKRAVFETQNMAREAIEEQRNILRSILRKFEFPEDVLSLQLDFVGAPCFPPKLEGKPSGIVCCIVM